MKKLKLVNKSPSKLRNRASLITTALFVCLVVYTLVLFIPIIWSVITAFVANEDYRIFYNYKYFKDVSFPAPKTFQNFIDAFNNLSITTAGSDRNPESTFNVFEMFMNSIVYSVGCAAVYTMVPCFVGYVAARFKFKFSKVIYAFVVIAMSLPIVGSMPSELRMLKNLGIDNTFFGMWVLRANFLSLYFLIFYAQFETIPLDYTEAAKVDGAGNWHIMTRVIFPQAIPTMVTVFALTFITFWNDYQIPLVYLPDYPTAAYCVFYFINFPQSGSITSDIPVQMAATIIMTLPIVIFFIIFNKRLRVGVSVGGIKG